MIDLTIASLLGFAIGLCVGHGIGRDEAIDDDAYALVRSASRLGGMHRRQDSERAQCTRGDATQPMEEGS